MKCVRTGTNNKIRDRLAAYDLWTRFAVWWLADAKGGE